MKRAYVLIPKNEAGKNDFEKILYLEAKRVDVLTPTSLIEAEEDEADRAWEELRGKIIKDAKGLDLKKLEPLEKVIELYFDVFKRHFEEAGLYPAFCYLAVLLIWEIFTKLGYEVKVMKSKVVHHDFTHYFTEIVDKITGLTWIFDATAEQFQEPFGDQYNSSRYEKN